jgi:uncharacterized C2H2 Zn-finger protein
MKEVTVTHRCDYCKSILDEEGDKVQLDRSIILNGTPFLVDVCVACEVEHLYPIRDNGRRVTRKQAKIATDGAARVQCDRCPKSFQTQRGLNHHVTKMHTPKSTARKVKKTA